MRQIAQAADVSVAGVYHYYESKQQMLVAILDSTMEGLIEGLEGAREKVADRPPAERFAAVVEALAYYHASSQNKAFIGASEMRSIEEPHRTRIAGLRRSVQHMIDEEAQAAAEAGVFTVADLKFACRLVANMCTSLAQWFDRKGPVSAEDAAANIAQYALAMMKVESADR
jgi:AcrR family transcriptional regulator